MDFALTEEQLAIATEEVARACAGTSEEQSL